MERHLGAQDNFIPCWMLAHFIPQKKNHDFHVTKCNSYPTAIPEGNHNGNKINIAVFSQLSDILVSSNKDLIEACCDMFPYDLHSICCSSFI